MLTLTVLALGVGQALSYSRYCQGFRMHRQEALPSLLSLGLRALARQEASGFGLGVSFSEGLPGSAIFGTAMFGRQILLQLRDVDVAQLGKPCLCGPVFIQERLAGAFQGVAPAPRSGVPLMVWCGVRGERHSPCRCSEHGFPLLFELRAKSRRRDVAGDLETGTRCLQPGAGFKIVRASQIDVFPVLQPCQGNGGQDFRVTSRLGEQAIAMVYDMAAALEGDGDAVRLAIDVGQARGQRRLDLLLVLLLQEAGLVDLPAI